MPHFFEKVEGDIVKLSPENAKHISGALRMRAGETITLCYNGRNYSCELTDVSKEEVLAKVVDCDMNYSEPNVDITLFQCVPKGDKLELVIQKAVELGVSNIVPVLSSRCVSRPDEKKAAKKNERYNKIALSACEQSGRGKIVQVKEQISFAQAVEKLQDYDLAILFYEGGGKQLKEIFKDNTAKKICIFIGPEGGFSDEEVSALENAGAKTATLGKRILRTETAPLAALVSIMLLTDNM